MRFHIVRSNETLQDIMTLYNLTKEEIMKENKHITSWRNLVPGTKLKIPAIPENVEQGIKDMEPFIEDYYPKLKSYTINKDDNVKMDNAKPVESPKESSIEEVIKPNIKDIPELKKMNEDVDNSYLYYPYYAQYQNYYPQRYARYPVYYPVYSSQEIDED